MAEGKFGKCREGLLVGYSCDRKENFGKICPVWLEIRFPVAHLGPYGSGRARERETDVTIAFYHRKEPHYGDRAMGWVKTRWLMLIGWSVSWWLVAS